MLSLKESRYTLKTSNANVYLYAFPFNVVQLLKERICSWGKFFPLRVVPFGTVLSPWEANGKPQKVFPLYKIGEKPESLLTNLELYEYISMLDPPVL